MFGHIMIIALLGLLLSGGATATTTHRGVNINPELVTEGDIAALAREWGANLVRILLASSSDCGICMVTDASSPSCSPVDFERLDILLDWCEQYGIRAVIGLHHFVGYDPHTVPADFRLWDSPTLQSAMVGFWKNVASRYANRGEVVYGYDLLNEPHTSDKQVPTMWLDLAQRVTAAIREVDPHHAVVVECGYGLPEDFLPPDLLEDPNTIYSFHFGEPYSFTHQGYSGLPAGIAYPSATRNKTYLRDLLEPVFEFQQRFAVQVYAGELVAYCFIDSAGRAAYLRDCLDLFEEWGFDYTYWAYRSWPQASLEHVGIEMGGKWLEDYVGETESLAVFKEYLSRNTLAPSSPPQQEKPRCLFDTSHWQPDLDVNVRTMNLAWRLSSMCDVDYLRTGRITKQALQDVVLLITGNAYGSTFSSGETRALEGFLARGGAILVYGAKDWGLNPFLSQFGIQINPSRIASSHPSPHVNDPYTFYATAAAGPPEVGSALLPFLVNYGASLDLSDPAVRVIGTGSETWRDANRNSKVDSGERKGPFAIVALAECGTGRLAVVADDEFRDVCTWPTYAALVSWLLGAESND